MSANDGDWFSPRKDRRRDGAWPPLTPPPSRSHAPRPDQQVWPPLARETPGGSTQPLPKVLDTEPPPPVSSEPAAPVSAEPAAPPPARRRGRTLLVAVAAVLLAGAAGAVRTYDGYLFYEKVATDETRLISVAPGQAGTAHGIEWQATVAPTQPPADNRHGADVAWLKIDIREKVVDQGSATMTAEPGEIQLQDRAGRAWTVELLDADRPTDRLDVGKEYVLEGVAIVPARLADEVELSFRPSTYRSDTPTEDLFKRDTVAALEPNTEVLRFRR
ncbi:hypothetical protein [Nonomuraea cavernae]|uniref:DUF4352 domain-containing protein n=1 Tax=Nonomuraea cavernae TaxID=2045107 RepID=A0A917YZ21_9ACTN|nr:hypothetical protein [Nonomuraea cavernae]MCA2187347.1 hypothetical protein [Nonomuraea cavernae]GGO68337.1 hypothetical protein GCM10012289_26870 [Nonomuraea cavernae]